MKSTNPQKTPPEFEQVIDEITELVVESLRQDYHNDLEPFEAYAARIRGRLATNLRDLRTRFNRGYHVLLEELDREKNR